MSQLSPPVAPMAEAEKPQDPSAEAKSPDVVTPAPQPETTTPPVPEGEDAPAPADQPVADAAEPVTKVTEDASPAPVLPAEPVADPVALPEVEANAPEAQDVAPAETIPPAPETSDAEVPQTTDKPALGEVAAADPLVDAPNAPQEAPAAPPSEAPDGAMANPVTEDPPPAEVVAESAAAPTAVAPQSPAALTEEKVPASAELPPPPPLDQDEEALLRPAPESDESPSTVPVEPAEPPPSVLQPAPALTDEADGVITGRLPRIGEAEAAEVPAEQPAEEAVNPADDESLPPLQRFARVFENPSQKPLFAILLQDDGADVDRAELAALDLPLTIVIDPLAEGAAERAALWRAGGQEVVLSGESVPEGATPGDLEQIFQALASRLPESVAVIDVTGSVFQNNRPLAAQIVPILADQGRGLVTFDQGLNAADQVARREGLASVTIFRRFDPDGAEAPAVKRYLDRAVFKAAQEGQVAVLGSLTPETVAGLMEWSIEGRASTVAMAPISALLLRGR